jgi:long-chain acyl-CoA synthetase
LNTSKKNKFILFNLKKFKNRRAVITESHKIYTYKDLDNLSNKFLLKIKKSKKLIFLLGQNNIETLVGYIAFLKQNHSIVIIDYKINNLFLNNLIKKYKPSYIYCPKNLKQQIKYKFLFEFKNYHFLERVKETSIQIHKDLCLLMSTSGSTGSPKLVKLSYNNFIANTKSISKFLKIKKKDVSITSLPFSYVYGLSVINTHLFNGSSLVLTNSSITEKNFWNLIERYKVNNLSGVPYSYSILERFFCKGIPKSIKYTTQAGGKMNDHQIIRLLNIYKKNNIKLIQMYGAAEATARMSYLNYKFANKKIGSIGKPIPGGKFQIMNENGQIINQQKTKGELVYFGKNVFMGYSNSSKDLSLPDNSNGILKTGDIAYKDKDGFYYIVGRKNRYTKIFGIRINLSELENILYKKGVDTIMREFGENKIEIYFKNLKSHKNHINYLAKLTNLNKNVFIPNKITQQNISRNYKLKL